MCARIFPIFVSLLSLARGEVVALSLPPVPLAPLAREVWGAEGDLDLGSVAEVRPARLPRGLSHCLAY